MITREMARRLGESEYNYKKALRRLMIDFTEYYASIVKDVNVGRSNWVDVALFDMGYRISNYYSLVGEREWTKDGKKPIQVRHNEFCFQMRLPKDMDELKTFCDR